jgi:molybdopterin converting factor small subunit
VDVDAKNVAEALRKLKKLFENNDEFHKLLKISNAILNGRNVLFLRGSRTKLGDGDKLAFFTPLGGG